MQIQESFLNNDPIKCSRVLRCWRKVNVIFFSALYSQPFHVSLFYIIVTMSNSVMQHSLRLTMVGSVFHNERRCQETWRECWTHCGRLQLSSPLGSGWPEPQRRLYSWGQGEDTGQQGVRPGHDAISAAIFLPQALGPPWRLGEPWTQGRGGRGRAWDWLRWAGLFSSRLHCRVERVDACHWRLFSLGKFTSIVCTRKKGPIFCVLF